MEKLSTPSLLSEILYTFLDKTFMKSDHWFALQLWQCWPELPTQPLVKQSKPVGYKNGQLLLYVATSVQLMEISFQIEHIKVTINRYFKKEWVRDIHFTLNKDIVKKRESSALLFNQIYPKNIRVQKLWLS